MKYNSKELNLKGIKPLRNNKLKALPAVHKVGTTMWESEIGTLDFC